MEDVEADASKPVVVEDSAIPAPAAITPAFTAKRATAEKTAPESKSYFSRFKGFASSAAASLTPTAALMHLGMGR